MPTRVLPIAATNAAATDERLLMLLLQPKTAAAVANGSIRARIVNQLTRVRRLYIPRE